MALTLAFDIYGTVIDTQGVITQLEAVIGNRAADFSRVWRGKQLEYSFRRGLMDVYADFGICTSQAFDYTCHYLGLRFDQAQRSAVLASYSELPAYADVKKGLSPLLDTGCHLFAFSNGRGEAVEALLNNAGIRDLFHGVVSCDEIKTFKPSPAVYTHFLERSKSSREDTWLVSSNPFDVIGATSAGLHSAWIHRPGSTPFDPWEFEATITINSLAELSTALFTPGE